LTSRFSSARLTIDGKWFSEFLKKYRDHSIFRNDLKTSEFLSTLGIRKSKGSGRENPEERFFEAFLLRSSLYRISRENPGYLEPFLIKSNWSDYADAWKIGKHATLHHPFRGKIAFLVSNRKRKELVCHPKTPNLVDKILFEPGFLSLRIPGVAVIPHHKAEVCEKILERCNSRVLQTHDLETIEKEAHANPERFLVILESLRLCIKKEAGYIIDGQGLFCDEIRKTTGFSNLEKAARVILRRDADTMMYISNVLLWLESLEKVSEPWSQPIGEGKDEADWFRFAAQDTSLNTPAIINVLREFSKFNAFLEWHPKELPGQTGYTCYATLSCHVDSLGLIGAYLQHILNPEDIFKTSLKIEKFKRHVDYLLRFIDRDSLIRVVNRKDLSLLRQRLTNSELINLNMDQGDLDQATSVQHQCFSNVFVVSKLPVKDSYFKEKILETLKSPHTWKDPQGHFYYPDFRFIMSAMMGLTFSAFDRVLAYQIQNDVDFYSRLFLPILWGIRIRKQKIDDSLLSVVPEPFDSIALRY
jgi:hypothetical protein